MTVAILYQLTLGDGHVNFYHCCFVPDPTPNSNREFECYEQPYDEYKEWVSLPFGKYFVSCLIDFNAKVLPLNQEETYVHG